MDELTPRERDILVALARTAGSNKEVAEVVKCSVGTTRVYISHAREKLTAQGHIVKSRYQLITWAKENLEQLLRPDCV